MNNIIIFYVIAEFRSTSPLPTLGIHPGYPAPPPPLTSKTPRGVFLEVRARKFYEPSAVSMNFRYFRAESSMNPAQVL